MTGAAILRESNRRISALKQRRDPITLYARRTAYALLLGAVLAFGAGLGFLWAGAGVFYSLTTGETLTKERVIGKTVAWLTVYGRKR